MNPKIYNTKEVAELFNVSDATIRNEVERGKLGYFKVGNEHRFTQYHIDIYTQIRDLGKSERELQLEEEKRQLLEVIEQKNRVITDIKNMILREI